jgi:hypothetical protein
VRVLFDQGTPVPLRSYLTDHEVQTAFERGWQTLENGASLRTAEDAGIEVLITTDKNLRYQQNLTERRIAILVLARTDWRKLRTSVASISGALGRVRPGDYVELSVP